MSQPPPYTKEGDQGAPPAGGQYPPPGTQYPPPGTQYPPSGAQYPPPGGQYAPPGPAPFKAGGYPARNDAELMNNGVVGGKSSASQAPGIPVSPAGTVVAQPGVVLIQMYHEAPVRTRCSVCGADIVTAVIHEVGTFTWVLCIILCFCVACLGLIPFFCDSCKDAVHYCPNCQTILGRYRRM